MRFSGSGKQDANRVPVVILPKRVLHLNGICGDYFFSRVTSTGHTITPPIVGVFFNDVVSG